MAVLEDPLQAVSMTVQDAMDLAPIYKKYDFRKGCLFVVITLQGL